MKSAIVFVVTIFVVYLFCAFVAADFDFRNWQIEGRFFAACIAAAFGFVSAGWSRI